jgi:glycosyltransferase involved in cell wall biosynthesis
MTPADRPLRILHVVHTLGRESGGPAEVVLRSSEALQALGHHVEIVSLDQPGAVTAPDHLRVHPLGLGGSYRFTPKLCPWLQEHHARFDAVLVNGLWQYQGWGTHRALRGTRTPYIVFPHGMLDPWFRRTYPFKHVKKQCYWWLREQHVLRDAAAVSFTCEQERILAENSFTPYRVKAAVVAFGTAAPSDNVVALRTLFLTQHPQLNARPFILFLGRLHPKKGLEPLLEAFAAQRAATSTSSATRSPLLVIAGPAVSEDYRRRLHALAARLGLSHADDPAVVWLPMLSGDVKWGALHACEAFILLSHQENFGIAVAEAMACAKPVLISDQVNIWREISTDAAGIVAADTVAGALQLLNAWQALTPAARERMGAAARESFTRQFEITRAARSLASLVASVAAPPR